MPSFWTNRGKYKMLQWVFNSATMPTTLYAALFQSSPAPTPSTNTRSGLTETPSGTGYTAGGQGLARNTTNFINITQDDTNNRALIRIKDLTWTATGGSLGPAAWLILTDDNSTLSAREVYVCFDFNTSVTVSSGQTLTITQAEMRLV